VLNDEMDDFGFGHVSNEFDISPSPANAAKPGKRPLSSMCPTVVTSAAGDVRLIAGAAGGTKITTSAAQVIARNLWMGQSVKESIAARRIHHQLEPMRVEYEEGLSKVSRMTPSRLQRAHFRTLLSTSDLAGTLCAVTHPESQSSWPSPLRKRRATTRTRWRPTRTLGNPAESPESELNRRFEL